MPPLLASRLLHTAFLVSLLVQHTIFHVLARTAFSGASRTQRKRRAWVLTTLNGAVLTAASLPFLADLLCARFDLQAVQPRQEYALVCSAFFVAYLLSDLGLGAIYYRELINFSSGWAHHTVYTFLFAYWVHRGWAHWAVMACVFELPTTIMGVASIWPALRSNNAFTSTFFLTRIFFHGALLCATITPHGRATKGIDGSWGVALSVLATYPMHIWWSVKLVASVRRRMHKRRVERLQARMEAMAANEGYFAAVGQFMNGLAPPETSSALNTPAVTPSSTGSSTPVFAESSFARTAPVAIHAAFAKAAAAGRAPLDLVRRRRAARSEPDAPASEASTSGASTPVSTPRVSLDVPSAPPLRRSLSANSQRRLLSVPVPPQDAEPDAQEPFLAIRSPAEAGDRARRLVADAVRKVWSSTPQSWQARFDDDDVAPPPGPRMARRASDETETDGEDLDDAAALAKTRAQRGRAAARRALVRAVRRAISGPGAAAVEGHEGDAAATGRSLAGLDLDALLRLGGLPPLPPDLAGREFDVRPLEVEQIAGQRRRRWVGLLRRRMEVARRDVVLWDE